MKKKKRQSDKAKKKSKKKKQKRKAEISTTMLGKVTLKPPSESLLEGLGKKKGKQ